MHEFRNTWTENWQAEPAKAVGKHNDIVARRYGSGVAVFQPVVAGLQPGRQIARLLFGRDMFQSQRRIIVVLDNKQQFGYTQCGIDNQLLILMNASLPVWQRIRNPDNPGVKPRSFEAQPESVKRIRFVKTDAEIRSLITAVHLAESRYRYGN